MKQSFSLFLILFCSSLLFAQSDSLKKAVYDFSPKLRLSGWQNDLEFSLQPNLLMNQISDSSTIMMRTRLQLAGLYKFNDEDQTKAGLTTNLLNPLHQEYLSTQSMKEIKYVLGMVSAGGVAYLAYEHIRKYGFLKKK
jgi:hypothetical protein